MRKLMPLLLAALIVVAPFINSCSQTQLNDAAQQYNPNYTIGIIKTTESKRSSYIEFYNEDLELVNSIWYPYATLWLNGPAPPAQKDGVLYLIPRGMMGEHNDRKVISLNLKTGAVREYAVDQVAFTCLAVDDNYIYASNNLNKVGHISRVNIENGDVIYLDLGTLVGNLVVHNRELHAYWCTIEDASTDYGNAEIYEYISRLDQDLNTLSTVNMTDITGAGSMACFSMFVGDQYYLTFAKKAEAASNVRVYDIYVWSVLDQEFQFLGECAHETSFIVPHRETLITLNSDANLSSSFIDIYDRQDGTLLNSLPLDYTPMQAAIDKNILYVQGFEELVKYSIDGSTVTELKRVGIPRIGSPTDTQSHYLSGIFLNR